MSDKNHQGDSESSEQARLDALTSDPDHSTVAAILRENAGTRLEIARLSKSNLRAWAACLVQAVVLLVLLTAWLFFFPKYRFIPTKDNQAICEINSQIAPDIIGPVVTDFAKDAVLHAYSYDYVNYRQTLNDVAARWFTDDGSKAFFRSLDDSGNLEKVIKGRLVLRSATLDVPQLERQGTDERFRSWWEVTVPVQIAFYANGETTPVSRQSFDAVVRVVQVPASRTNSKGISVDMINLSPTVGASR